MKPALVNGHSTWALQAFAQVPAPPRACRLNEVEPSDRRAHTVHAPAARPRKRGEALRLMGRCDVCGELVMER